MATLRETSSLILRIGALQLWDGPCFSIPGVVHVFCPDVASCWLINLNLVKMFIIMMLNFLIIKIIKQLVPELAPQWQILAGFHRNSCSTRRSNHVNYATLYSSNRCITIGLHKNGHTWLYIIRNDGDMTMVIHVWWWCIMVMQKQIVDHTSPTIVVLWSGIVLFAGTWQSCLWSVFHPHCLCFMAQNPAYP